MLGKFFDKLLKIIAKILAWLGVFIIIVYILLWIFCPALIPVFTQLLLNAWAAAQAFIVAAWQWIVAGAGFIWNAIQEWVGDASIGEVFKLALGAATILNPEGVAEGVGSVIEAVAKVATPLLPYIGVGLLLWFLLKKDKDDSKEIVITDRASGSSPPVEAGAWRI